MEAFKSVKTPDGLRSARRATAEDAFKAETEIAKLGAKLHQAEKMRDRIAGANEEIVQLTPEAYRGKILRAVQAKYLRRVRKSLGISGRSGRTIRRPARTSSLKRSTPNGFARTSRSTGSP